MSLSVIVCGMDPRARLWPPFKHGFDKFWRDCPWHKYFITNFLDAPEGFTTLRTGREFSWADKAIKALKLVPDEHLLWLMEDFWLPGPVQTQEMAKFHRLMVSHPEIDHIRLMPPCRGTSEVTPEEECSRVSEYDPRLWHFKEDAEYRISVTASFWRKDSLLGYIKDGMTPWSFEREGSVASRGSRQVYLCCVDPRVFPLPHHTNPYQFFKNEMVSKGVWNKAAMEYIDREGLEMDFSLNPDGSKIGTGPFL